MEKQTTSNKKAAALKAARIKKRRQRERRKRAIIIGAVALLLIIVGVIVTVNTINEQKRREAEAFAARYPMKYTDIITQYARENELEPAYVAAVILAESSYDPNATSSVGAQGLMQIMPETGEWIGGKFEDRPYYEGCLYDPDTNVKYGCWYLGYLLRRYNGDKRCASAAYHSGQGTVDGWLKDPAYSSDGVTLDVIGGENAPIYVDRVLDNYEVYTGLYEEA